MNIIYLIKIIKMKKTFKHWSSQIIVLSFVSRHNTNVFPSRKVSSELIYYFNHWSIKTNILPPQADDRFGTRVMYTVM